jgi:hypothetical protein
MPLPLMWPRRPQCKEVSDDNVTVSRDVSSRYLATHNVTLKSDDSPERGDQD